MVRHLRFIINIGIVLLLVMGVTVRSGLAQNTEPIGGPYESDSATVLLLHFDQDYTNDHGPQYEIAEPNIFGDISFLQMEGAGDLDYQVRFLNDSEQDKSHIQIPDTTALDLTGSWTMEMWVNVFTFGQTREDWRRQPRLLTKSGDPDEAAYWQSNFFFAIFGTLRDFKTGYRNAEVGTQVQIDSPQNMLEIGEWFHLTFIRDTSKQVIVQMIHQNAENRGRLPNANDDELELISFKSFNYGEADLEGSPRTSDQPLFIGTSPQHDTLFANLDGFMDEVRISNTVRNFAIPPIISGMTAPDNQEAGEDYEVQATIETIGDSEISTATLHYRVDDGTWQDLTMAEGANNIYTAAIPSQEEGATVTYWVEAETDGGLRALSPSTAEDPEDPEYYSFAIWQSETKTLHLSFEEGSGTPVDSSLYDNPVEVIYGDPVYSDDAARGDYSMSLKDSTYLNVDSPFLSSNRSRTELWFKADTISSWRLIISSGSTWWQANSQIWYSGSSLEAGSNFLSEGNIEVGIDSAIIADRWYQAIYQVMSDSIMFELRNENDELIQRKFADHGGTEPIQAAYPLIIGNSPIDNHRYSGLVDEVKMYNYPTDTTFATSIGDQPRDLPGRVELNQNYPNPFNPTTEISYDLPRSTQVTLTVYDMLGRKVRTLVDARQSAGTHSVTFEAQGLSSGVYLYRLKTDGVSRTHKMMLMK